MRKDGPCGHDYIGHNYIGHNYMGHNYIGHKYTGHIYTGHIYTGHNYIGHNYIGHRGSWWGNLPLAAYEVRCLLVLIVECVECHFFVVVDAVCRECDDAVFQTHIGYHHQRDHVLCLETKYCRYRILVIRVLSLPHISY